MLGLIDAGGLGKKLEAGRRDLGDHPTACQCGENRALRRMRIFQDEIYQKGERLIRIVRLDRYEVEFKETVGDPKGPGDQTVLSKKEFCRLIRGMERVFPVKNA